MVFSSTHDVLDFYELFAVVHTLSFIWFGADRPDMSILSECSNCVGEVVLVLGIIGTEFAQSGQQFGMVEHIDPGIPLCNEQLSRCGIALFDNSLDRAISFANDAPVSGGVIEVRS